MPGFGRVLGRRAGPWATAFAVYDVWRRIPPKQRKLIVVQVRKHGPRLAMRAYEVTAKRRKI